MHWDIFPAIEAGNEVVASGWVNIQRSLPGLPEVISDAEVKAL